MNSCPFSLEAQSNFLSPFQSPFPIPSSYLTTSRDTHCDPKEMTTHPNILKVKLESVRDLKARNKEGMPYSMLFTNEASLKNHGPLYMTSMQRFDAAGAGADFAIPTGRNVNERRKELVCCWSIVHTLRQPTISAHNYDAPGMGVIVYTLSGLISHHHRHPNHHH